MADQPNPQEEAEKEYWDRFRSHLDGWFSDTMKKYEDERAKNPPKETPSTGTSRTGAKRVTLPGLIADMVFGPEKD